MSPHPSRTHPRRRRALVAWSSGKDAAWTLHVLRAAGEVAVVGLLTTTTSFAEGDSRVPMHGVREPLLAAQAAAAGLPLWRVPIPSPCSNAQYEAAMDRAVQRAVAEGISAIAFGDLFLEDVRRYREEKLAGTGIAPLFPLWGRDTAALAREMIAGGLRARVACVDPRRVPAALAGAEFDRAFLGALPADVDPCGERGEFHSFAFAGPMFAREIPVVAGETSERDGLVLADLVPPDGS